MGWAILGPQTMVHASCQDAELCVFLGHAPVPSSAGSGDGSHGFVPRFNVQSTTKEAGRLARQAGVKTLILGHVSLRYRDLASLCEEASQEHDDVIVATDGMVIRIGA